MSEQDLNEPSPTRIPWLILAGVVIYGVAGLVEGVITGTEHARRFPNAVLVAFAGMLVGQVLLLIGYARQLSRAGLPSKPLFFVWTLLAAVAFTVGWSNLRGAIPHLDESLRDKLVLAGIASGVLGAGLAVVACHRWYRGLSLEQQELHRQLTRPWLITLATVVLVVWPGSILVRWLITA